MNLPKHVPLPWSVHEYERKCLDEDGNWVHVGTEYRVLDANGMMIPFQAKALANYIVYLANKENK